VAKGELCGQHRTAEQGDNAIEEKLDVRRVAVLRSGSNFTRPYPGQSAAEGLISYEAQGGYEPAAENLLRAAKPVIDAIVADWKIWQQDVPKTD
jgi:purine nucleoside permease